MRPVAPPIPISVELPARKSETAFVMPVPCSDVGTNSSPVLQPVAHNGPDENLPRLAGVGLPLLETNPNFDPPQMMQFLMAMAYDSASNNARRLELDRREQEASAAAYERRLELERREQDLKRKERAEEERASRLNFLAQAAEACKRFSLHR